MLEQHHEKQLHGKPGTKLPSSVLTTLSMPTLEDCEADSGLVHQQDGLLQRDFAECRQAFQIGVPTWPYRPWLKVAGMPAMLAASSLTRTTGGMSQSVD